MPKSHAFLRLTVCSLLLHLTQGQSLACGTGSSAITNMPTLGGSVFQVSAINSTGQIAGFSYTSGDLAQHAILFSNGQTTDLGTFGGIISEGLAINASGQVAGDANTVGDAQTHAAFYDGTNLVDLGTLGGSFSSATALNDAGQVAGYSLTSGDAALDAFLYSNGVMHDLGSLGGGGSTASAINQSGLVIGSSTTTNFENHAFLYTNGVMVDLGTLGGDYSSAYAINTAGTVVGESSVANFDTHGFVYSSGSMQDVGTLGGTFSSARAINDAGQVIGLSTTTNDAQTHGFLYASGTLTDLGALGSGDTIPSALNNAGVVVGYSVTPDGQAIHAFRWQNGTMTDLNTLLPAGSGWELNTAELINDAGRIVGYGVYQGNSQVFILDPSSSSSNQPPIAVAGPNQTVECQSPVILDASGSSDPDGDALSYEWSTGGNVLGTNVTLSGTFSLGTNVVTLKVTDACGAASQATVTVVVVDTTAPGLTCPGNVTVSSSTNCLAVVPNLASQAVVSDTCAAAGSISVSQNPLAGSLVGLGPHTIIVTATDPSGNSATCNTILTVVDATPPVFISGPALAPIAAGAGCQGIVPSVTGQIVATDNCTPAGSLLITQSPQAGTLAGLGQHTIAVTVTDGAGNSTSGSVSFSVVDATSPAIVSVPGPITASADGNCQAVVPNVVSSVVATDGCTPANQLIITQSPAAGTFLALGQHTIVVVVMDASGNSSTANVSFKVVDTTAPVILNAPSSLTVSANSQCQATVPNVLANVVAADSCTPANQLIMTQSPAAGTVLSHGQYVIVVTVTDASGNSASRNIPFTIADTTAPVFQSLSVTPNVLSTPNHQMVPVTVSATVSDNCDSAPVTKIVSITSNEAVVAGEIQITGNLTASLAATRNGSGNGRVYTITVRSTDSSGNSSNATVTVTVPKGNGKG